MTLKLNGGISSSAILNKDQTELQTIIKKINKITVNKFLLFLFYFLSHKYLDMELFTAITKESCPLSSTVIS